MNRRGVVWQVRIGRPVRADVHLVEAPHVSDLTETGDRGTLGPRIGRGTSVVVEEMDLVGREAKQHPGCDRVGESDLGLPVGADPGPATAACSSMVEV